MQTEKFQPEDNRIMPETRFTSFPALSVYPRVVMSLSALETDVRLLFYTIEIVCDYDQFVTVFHCRNFIIP